MERIVLDKLNWDLHFTTALDFLYIVSTLPHTHTHKMPPNFAALCTNAKLCFIHILGSLTGSEIVWKSG